MDATRCLDCGDVRWSLLGLAGRTASCSECGGELVAERRRPASGAPTTLAERRDLVAVRERASAERSQT